MKYHPLQEVAKFAAGLVAADFFWLVWFSQQHLRSASFFGTTVSQEMILPGIIFDIALFLMLVHYGWNIGRIPNMRERQYVLVAGVIFTLVAAAHIYRLFSGADFTFGDWDAPVWLSWIGVTIAVYLAYTSFHFAARMKK